MKTKARNWKRRRFASIESAIGRCRGARCLALHKVPEPKTVKNRLHVDLITIQFVICWWHSLGPFCKVRGVGDANQNSPLGRLRSMEWSTDSVNLGGLAFDVRLTPDPSAPLAGDLNLCKTQGFLHNYEVLLAARPDFQPRRILELGIWRGGSVALWNEVFQPERLSAIDFLPERVIPALAQYVDAATTITLHWNTSQDDIQALTNVVAEDFDGQLPDLVIDDASHLYWPTRRSFEWLFPRMAPGALYVIEDWRSSVESASPDPLHLIAADLVSTKALGRNAIRSVTVQGGIIVVDRSNHTQDDTFTLAPDRGTERPAESVRSRLRHLVGR